MAIVAAYAAGLLSLSRPYVVTTYMVLGLVTAFAGLAAANRPVPLMRFNPRLLLRLATASVTYLVAIYAVVRVFAHWG